MDATHEREVAPVALLYPKLTERLRLYALCSSENVGNFQAEASAEEQFGSFIQGGDDNNSISSLPPAQIGVALTFAPPLRGCVLHNGALLMLRRAFAIVIKKTTHNDLSEGKWSG